jgi:ligand-binding sensor protein
MKLTDLLSLEKWTEFEKEVHARSGLDASIFNTDGIRITDYKKWANRICPVIKDNDKGQAFICAVAHMNLATQARRTKIPVIEECDAGLLKLVVPLFVEDQFIGAFGACGLLLDDGEVDTFMINKTIDTEEETLEELSSGIDAITSKAAASLARFIENRLAEIVNDYKH